MDYMYDWTDKTKVNTQTNTSKLPIEIRFPDSDQTNKNGKTSKFNSAFKVPNKSFEEDDVPIVTEKTPNSGIVSETTNVEFRNNGCWVNTKWHTRKGLLTTFIMPNTTP